LGLLGVANVPAAQRILQIDENRAGDAGGFRANA